MESSLLHSQVDTFQERNATLFFLLGLVSFSQRLMRDLQAELGEPEPVPPLCVRRVDEPGGAPADNGFLYFMLGLISFSSHVSEVLQAEQARWTQQREADDKRGSAAAKAGDLRGLLR